MSRKKPSQSVEQTDAKTADAVSTRDIRWDSADLPEVIQGLKNIMRPWIATQASKRIELTSGNGIRKLRKPVTDLLKLLFAEVQDGIDSEELLAEYPESGADAFDALLKATAECANVWSKGWPRRADNLRWRGNHALGNFFLKEIPRAAKALRRLKKH